MEPTPSQTIRYDISISVPERWKIDAIANYKRRQISQKIEEKNKASNSQGSKKKNKRNASEGNGTGPGLSIKPPEGLASAHTTAPPTPTSTSIVVENTRPDLTAAQKQAILENSLRDLEVLNHTSNILKTRIAHLHQVRGHLLWLLKKSAAHERTMIHENISTIAAADINGEDLI